MSINNNYDLPTFKIGDSFNVPIRFYDDTNKQGIPLTSEIIIDCKISDSIGNVFSTPEIVKYQDQVVDAGFFLLKVPSSETINWKSGIAILDLKIKIADEVRHSENFSFKILKGIT